VEGILKLYQIRQVSGFLPSGPITTGIIFSGKTKEGGKGLSKIKMKVCLE